MNNRSHIEIRMIKENDFFELMECHLLAFAHEKGEAMMNALAITPAESESFSQFVCEKAIAEQLSVLAWDHDAQKVAGFCINEPFSTIADFTQLPLDEKFAPLFEFLKQIDQACLTTLRVTTDRLFHLFNLGVLKEYRRHGLAKQLLLESLEIAADAGFEFAVAETTGTGSQTMCSRLGFRTLHALAYKDFTMDGTTPFAVIEEPKQCLLMGIEI